MHSLAYSKGQYWFQRTESFRGFMDIVLCLSSPQYVLILVWIFFLLSSDTRHDLHQYRDNEKAQGFK